jgi:hypothetical protein
MSCRYPGSLVRDLFLFLVLVLGHDLDLEESVL